MQSPWMWGHRAHLDPYLHGMMVSKLVGLILLPPPGIFDKGSDIVEGVCGCSPGVTCEVVAWKEVACFGCLDKVLCNARSTAMQVDSTLAIILIRAMGQDF